jgi:hypothetical protein
MFARGFPMRGMNMETIAALFGAIARALRGLFDLVLMAVGIAPTTMPLADAAFAGATEAAHTKADWRFAQDEKSSRIHREAMGLHWDCDI